MWLRLCHCSTLKMMQLSPAGKMKISHLFLTLNHPQALHLKIKNLLYMFKILDSVYRNPTVASFFCLKDWLFR